MNLSPEVRLEWDHVLKQSRGYDENSDQVVYREAGLPALEYRCHHMKAFA